MKKEMKKERQVNEGITRRAAILAVGATAGLSLVAERQAFAQTTVKPYTYVVDVNGNGDFTTITNALLALGTNPGVIKIREGTYSNEIIPLNLHNGQWLIGSGINSTIIRPSASATGNGVIVMNPTTINGKAVITDQAVMNLMIDGSMTTNVIDGIYAENSYGAYCSDVGNFSGCLNAISSLITCNSTCVADAVRLIENVWIWGMKGNGASLLAGGNWTVKNLLVTQNRLTGLLVGRSPSTGEAAHGVFDTVLALYNGRDHVPGDNYGIYIENAQAVTFRNCAAELNNGNNLYAYNNTGMNQLLISGCIFEASESAVEIYIRGYNEVRITSNYALPASASGTTAYKIRDCSNVTLVGNIADGAQYGYYIQNCNNMIGESNVDKNCTTPIFVNAGNNLNIHGHATNNIGFVITVGSIAPTNSVAMYNDFKSGSPYPGLNITVFDSNGAFMTYYLQSGGHIRRGSDGRYVKWSATPS